MKIVLKNVDLYNPEHFGITNLVIENGIITNIGANFDSDSTMVDCEGKICCPGFVDGHEHILGNYYTTHGIASSGVTTLVGVLANEPNHNYVDKLINVTKSFSEDGFNAFCLCGSKNYTEDLTLYLSDPVVVGIKTALFQPQRPKPNLDYEHLKNYAVKIFEASKKENKTLQLHIHLDHPYKRGGKIPKEEIETGKHDNLGWIDQIVKETGVPYSIFKLTHAQKYYKRILEYANKGCYIDYNAFDSDYDKRFDVLIEALKNNSVDASKVSISSDLGVLTKELGLTTEETPKSILNTVTWLVRKGLPLEKVLPLATSNPASLLPNDLGKIQIGGKADLVILNKNFEIENVFMSGKSQLNDIKIKI